MSEISNKIISKELIEIIKVGRNEALKKVNEVLINMYWNIGEKLLNISQNFNFGDSYIDNISNDIAKEFPGIKGFDRRGLYRMKQFYETYKDDEFVSTLLTQIGWASNIMIQIYFFIIEI